MQKIDFNLLRLFPSFVWFADFLSFKRLTRKRGFYGASLVLQFPLQSFFSVLSFTSVLLDIKLILSLHCNSTSFSGNKI